MSYALGIDLGSSSVKVSLVDVLTGKCAGSDFYPKREMKIMSVKQGWAEQDPEEWWTNLKLALQSAMNKAGAKAQEVKAIGIAYQMHGLILVDTDLKIIRNSIIWCDSRAVTYGEKARKVIGDAVCLKRYLNFPGNFTLSKLAWVKEHETQNYERARFYMLPGDYLAMRMTGNASTTVSGLSEGIGWNFSQNKIAKSLFDALDIDIALVPTIVPTFGCQGNLKKEVAQELGLSVNTPITYRAGDQPNNALSLNVLNPGEVAATAGTSGVVYGVNESFKADLKNRINSFAHVNHTLQNRRIGALLCINGTAIMNAWMKNTIASEGLSYENMNTLASQIPIGSEGLTIVPFGNGAERMFCNKELGASVHGINLLKHGKSHLIRAAQEGIAFSFRYGMDIMNAMGMKTEKIRAGHANLFLSPVFRQTLADATGATIELYNTDGSIGAARGAAVGAGLYDTFEDAFSSLKRIETIEPQSRNIEVTQEAYQRFLNIINKDLN